MNLVGGEMVELQHVQNPDCDIRVEGLPGSPVEEHGLPALGQPSVLELGLDLLFDGAVEDRRGDVNPLTNVLGQGPDRIGRGVVENRRDALIAVEILQLVAKRIGPNLLFEHVVHLLAEPSRRPPEVGFENLPDVHAGGHAQRVENDVDRLTLGGVRHVLLGKNP